MITLGLFIGGVVALLAALIYKHLNHLNYWRDRGVFSPKPSPIFGNTYQVATFSRHVSEVFKDLYDQTDEPYLGVFLLDQPVLLVKSPQLIKRILIKDFHRFRDRSIAASKHSEIFRNFLLMARSQRWKELRTQLSPFFTSGKLKSFVDQINEVSDSLMVQICKSEGPLCVKEIYTNFVTEAIAKCYFNIETKCLDDEKSIFREILRRLFHPSWQTMVTQILYFVRTSWVEFFRLDFVDTTALKFLMDVFHELIETRKESRQRQDKSKDIVDIMIDNKNKNDREFGKTGHFASGLQFLVAGIETTGTGLSWFMFEMANREDVQDKLRTEIVTVLKKHAGKLTYRAVQQMKYLDMCYLETLRRYPFIPFLDRQAMDDYEIEETGLVIEKGTLIFIPLFALSLDEKHFPEPLTFVPERFAESGHAHANDEGLVFVPFGAGQRVCLGERFAILATKLVVVTTLLNYRLEKCSRTPGYPVAFSPRTTFLECEGGLPVKFTKITTDT